jgi:hypothetical protein
MSCGAWTTDCPTRKKEEDNRPSPTALREFSQRPVRRARQPAVQPESAAQQLRDHVWPPSSPGLPRGSIRRSLLQGVTLLKAKQQGASPSYHDSIEKTKICHRTRRIENNPLQNSLDKEYDRNGQLSRPLMHVAKSQNLIRHSSSTPSTHELEIYLSQNLSLFHSRHS